MNVVFLVCYVFRISLQFKFFAARKYLNKTTGVQNKENLKNILNHSKNIDHIHENFLMVLI